MIRFEQVTKVLGGAPVLNRLSFEVRRGEVFVIVGSSGAGKSVTLKHMVRLLTPDDGRVSLDGRDVGQANARDLERIRERFGYLFQGGALLAWLSVAENIALPLREKTRLSEDAIQARVRDVLDRVGLADAAEKMPSEISGGMQKRAGLARAIVREPEIVLYDEPTSGLDPVTARTIDSLITKMQQDLGVTSVVVTHDLHSALSIGSRIALLAEGTFLELAEPHAFIRSARPEVQRFLESQYITRDGSWETPDTRQAGETTP
jgi:phospholipid/cholesterol/gamma-HCH transport system ATP-binding protein